MSGKFLYKETIQVCMNIECRAAAPKNDHRVSGVTAGEGIRMLT